MDGLLTIGRWFLIRSFLGKKVAGVFLAFVAGRKVYEWSDERVSRLPAGQSWVDPAHLGRYGRPQ